MENVAAAFLHTSAHVDFFLILVSFQNQTVCCGVLSMAGFAKANAEATARGRRALRPPDETCGFALVQEPSADSW